MRRQNKGTCRTCLALATTAAFMLTPIAAGAAGLGRPTVTSARAYGFGGAFTAVADDATALHYNPAGLALQPRDSILLGLQLALPIREYTPMKTQSGVPTEGKTESSHKDIKFLPTLGYSTRLKSHGVPSRIALGIGAWNTYGGSGVYDPTRPNTHDKAMSVLFELVPGIAYEVNDFLAIGAGLRLGLGIFQVVANDRPVDGEIESMGLGAGVTLGVMLTPVADFRIGLVYRSAITASTAGSGTSYTLGREKKDGIVPVDVSHEQPWPQAASLGLAYRLGRVRLSTQVDWTDWSKVDQIVAVLRPVYPDDNPLVEDYDFQDSIAVHAGGEISVSQGLELRAGYTLDGNAIPDRTLQRHQLGGPKHGVALGTGVKLGETWRVDAAFEWLFGKARVVENNDEAYRKFQSRANQNPGTHDSRLYTLEVNVQRVF
ncbi:MAG: outer membrane protein transport protein [Deltaproteobacteria bacterium]|nr:outer membrane protein transport protein [Deltaproteobacteria bacterium]